MVKHILPVQSIEYTTAAWLDEWWLRLPLQTLMLFRLREMEEDVATLCFLTQMDPVDLTVTLESKDQGICNYKPLQKYFPHDHFA